MMSNNDILRNDKKIIETNMEVFSAYKIYIEYPENWRIHINTNREFSFNDGFIKIEGSSLTEKDKHSVSLAVRFSKTKNIVNIDMFIKELEKSYAKKQKKNKMDNYSIIRNEPLFLEHKSYFMHSKITANHGIYRILSKDEELEVLQLSTFCENTNRIIVASVSASPDSIRNNFSFYKEILLTLRCH